MGQVVSTSRQLWLALNKSLERIEEYSQTRLRPAQADQSENSEFKIWLKLTWLK